MLDTLWQRTWPPTATPSSRGTSYLLFHLEGERRWPYHGFCRSCVVRGHRRHQPRFPFRNCEHLLCIQTVYLRDSDYDRYKKYRKWGVLGIGSFPIYEDEAVQAFNYEQMCHRTLRPKAVGREEQHWRVPRVRNCTRHRPPQQVRRRRRRDRGIR